MTELTKMKAIEVVIDYEKKQGRTPEIVSKRNQGYNIKSNDRFIDVKVNSKKSDVLMSFSVFKKLGKQISNYYVYLVEMENKKPIIKILDPDLVLKNFSLLTLVKIKENLIKGIKKVEA